MTTRAESERRLRAFVATWVHRLAARRSLIITTAITLAVDEWLKWLGAERVSLEVAVGVLGRRVDAMGEWQDGRRLYVEIDQTPKEGSHRKLMTLRRDGHRVVWVRWDNVTSGPDTEGIIPCVWISREARALMSNRARRARAKPLPVGGPPARTDRVIRFDDAW